MKTNKIFTFAALSALLTAGSLASCSDWNEHYTDSVNKAASGKVSAWALISSDTKLSDFAGILKEQGYDRILDGSETYTVWAPENGKFDAAQVKKLSNDQIVKQFIDNHIARSNYPASGTIENKLFMLNKKTNTFSGTTSFKIDTIEVLRPNLATSNGVVHTIGGQLPYFENIYERINSEVAGFTKVKAYYNRYAKRVLNEKKSVPGTIVNGEQTYLEAVYDESNNLFDDLNQYINEEDSSYTYVLLSDEAYNKAYEQIKQYNKYPEMYNVIDEVPERERGKTDKQMIAILNPEGDKLKHESVDTTLTDSVTNIAALSPLCFNNNFYYNKGLANFQTGQQFSADSIVSTCGVKIYAEDAAKFISATTREKKSNGSVLVCNDFNLPSWTQTFSPLFLANGHTGNLLNHWNAITPTMEYINSSTLNPKVVSQARFLNNYYLLASPESSNGNPTIAIGLSANSGTVYNIYVTTLPNNITNERADSMPCRFQAYLGYTEADGTLAEVTLKGPDGNQSSFSSEMNTICEIQVGSFEFPVVPRMAYIRLVGYASGKNYVKDLRIANVMLVPQELDAYLKAHPEYISKIQPIKF